MNIAIVALLILLILLLIFIILSFVFAYIITHGLRMTPRESWDWQQEHVPATRRFTRDMFTDYTVKGPKGEDIHVSFLPAGEASDRYVILAHGYTDSRFGMVKYVPHYHDMGFNCIMYDELGHGDNKFAPCSYCVREVEYLLAVLKDSFNRYGADIRPGLHGESLGGAIILYSLKFDIVKENVSFLVDDCGFADIMLILENEMRKRRLPGWFAHCASFAARIMYGISFEEARPIDSVKGNRIPLLCMHGADDDFILPLHSRMVYDTTEGLKEIYLTEGAGHAGSAVVGAEGYGKVLKSFLNKAGIV